MYLKTYCNASVFWGEDGSGIQMNLPASSGLPDAPATRMVSPVKWRYYWNVCTASYSGAYWDWGRWQYEIDLMALNGVNLPLAFTGQEFVWQALYATIGLTQEEMDAYFSGSAFFAWQRMGNIQGWGGPLTSTFVNAQHQLQLQILNATRGFGMMGVLPGFSGHVPAALKRVYPDANLTYSAPWGGFNSTYTADALLEPTDPLFQILGSQFYKILVSTYGTDGFYNADTYNEMNPSSGDLQFLAASNKAVYSAMTAQDPSATFVMQAWLFHSGFWTPDRVQAYLSGVPSGDAMLILDLNTDAGPLWQQYDSYYGKQWAWCMLHNYGGRRALYGNLTRIANGPVEDIMQSPSMVATGLTPEAIENNPVVYELMFEMGWRSEAPVVSDWVSAYVTRRYGRWSPMAQAAWALLLDGVYNQPNPDTSEFTQEPTVGLTSSRNANATAVTMSWRLLVSAGVSGEVDVTVGPYRQDVVDFGRQHLSNLFSDVHTMNMLAFQKFQFFNYNSSVEVGATSTFLLGLLQDLDSLLATDPNFLLGKWQSKARSFGSTAEELSNLEFNARNQLTLWGYSGALSDYAAKHWSGLVGDYYLGRWQLLLSRLTSAVTAGTPMDFPQYLTDVFAFETAWGKDNKTYPSAPVGDTMAVASSLLNKYASEPASPQPTYTMHPNSDAPCTGCDILQAWSLDVATLMVLCNADPTCVGFTSTGFVKNSTATISPYPGANLYTKN